MTLYLLDSDVLIAFLRQQEQAVGSVRRLAEADHDLAVSPISLVEVMAGVRPKEVSTTRALLNSLLLFPLEREIAYRAADLIRDQRRKGRTFSLADAVIGASALHHKATLLSYNVRHYPIPDLRLESPS